MAEGIAAEVMLEMGATGTWQLAQSGRLYDFNTTVQQRRRERLDWEAVTEVYQFAYTEGTLGLWLTWLASVGYGQTPDKRPILKNRQSKVQCWLQRFVLDMYQEGVNKAALRDVLMGFEWSYDSEAVDRTDKGF